MENKEKFDSWRELLKDKMQSYQPEGVAPDWQNFEAKMSAGKGINPYFGSISGKLMIAAAGLLAVVIPTVYFLHSNDNQTISEINQPLNANSISENQSQDKIVNESTADFRKEVSSPAPIAAHSQNSGENTNHQPSVNGSNDKIAESSHLTDNSSINEGTGKQVQDNPILPDAGFTFTLSGNCAPVTARCYPNVLSDSVYYIWTTSDGQSSSAASPKFRFETEGNYSISLTTSYLNSKHSNALKESHTFEVYAVPNSDFLVDMEDLSYHFKVAVLGADTYKWKIAELTVENETEVDYSFVKSGTYSVQLTATSDKACFSETKKEIKVEVVHPIFIGNAFTPDGDGNNDYFGPKSETLKDFEYRFEVYNRNGGVIFVSTDPYVLWDGNMNGIDKAPEGFYIYKIYTKDKYGNSQVKTGDVLLMRKK